ncbi:MurR/RpiR family transcriptional regulator [Pectinatus cerevisiiphilus]|uniref:RpiR family transcriptional regulator n=1 Tax=Pectinatus cerevisiiphilus TaxID=86956 RepID=A0A4R3K8U4_9FIRM|nr:MurR/RpiR family transcriptional regulator [Pectinatus cerevisiiphilus]TCS79315.1 RpiR family transcriptional regulator [Pectinatus cerevisiiphilus]
MGKNIETFEQLTVMLKFIADTSPTYKKIAIYINDNYLQIVFMTTNELAEQVGVSQGSISRFFMALGYRGYNDFLQNLQNIVSKELTAPKRLQFTEKHGIKDKYMHSIFDNELANMEKLGSIMETDEYKKIVSMLASSKPLILLSARMSSTIVPYVQYILNKMRGMVYKYTPSSPQWDTIELADPENVNILAVMMPRYPRVLVEKCQRLKEKKFHIYGVTDSEFSPLMECSDAAVCVPLTVSSIFDIYSTPMIFFNILLRDAAKEIPGISKRMEDIEKIELENKVYY